MELRRSIGAVRHGGKAGSLRRLVRSTALSPTATRLPGIPDLRYDHRAKFEPVSLCLQVPSTRYPSALIEGSTSEFEDPEDAAMSYDSPRPLAGVPLALSPQPSNKLDSNMNKPLPNNNNQAASVTSPSRDPARRVSTLETAVPSHKLGFDMPSVVSMEILESQPAQHAADCSEARNDAVIQRVSELKRLVEDAEQYLTVGSTDRTSRISDVETSSLLSDMSQLSKTESDLSGSGAGAGYGRLRHSDSLLLLTQGQKQLSLPDNTTVLLDVDHGSSSDTDSVNTTPNHTPTHSPSQRPKAESAKHNPPPRPPSMLKPSDSSFGLHSPDVLPVEQQDLEGLLKRLKDDLPLPEGSLIYIDPDIIDLTMIPPPITPEEEGLAMKFPTTINAPPTPFADRDSLENELAAMKPARNRSDLGDLEGLNDLAQWSNTSDSSVMNDSGDTDVNESVTTDTLSLSGISTVSRSIESLASSRSSSAGSISAATVIENKRRPTPSDKLKNPELDKFLSSVVIPLPPTNEGKLPGQQGDFAGDDLSAYIIPPPPANTGANANMAILQKLYAAREGIFQVMREDPATQSGPMEEKDRGSGEVRVRFEQREQRDAAHGISPKIGEIQRMLASGSSVTDSASTTKGTTPDLSPASSHSSGYGSLKSIAECSNSAPPELPARQPAGQISPRKNGLTHFKIPALNPVNGSLRAPGSFRPTFLNDENEDDDIPPPPPPPRNPIPRMIIASAAHARAAQGKSMETIPLPPPGPLTKSSSQVIPFISIIRT